MSRNASGTYSLPLADVVAGNDIEAAWANTSLADIATELTDSLSRSGKGGLSASVPGDVGCTGTFSPEGDTAAGDNAAVGYTATEGLILAGQGSTNDVTIKNDADADVFSIPTGTTRGVFSGKVEPEGDTAAGDNAAIGYTAAEGLILTGQGSTNDVTIKNDADADVIVIPTGTVRLKGSAGNDIDSGLFAIKGSTETVTSSDTYQDDDDLTVTLEGSSTYRIEAFLDFFSTSSTPDAKHQWVDPADIGWSAVYTYAPDSGGSGTVSGKDQVAGGATVVAITANQSSFVTWDITAIVTTGGEFKLQWAQNTSDGTNSRLQAGSWLRATKLA